MILYFSGSTSGQSLPERALYDDEGGPSIMLTYFEMHEGKGDTINRFERHSQRRKEQQRADKKRRATKSA